MSYLQSYLPPPSAGALFAARGGRSGMGAHSAQGARLGAHSAQGARLGAIRNFRMFNLRGLSNGSTTPTDTCVSPDQNGYCSPTLPPQGPTIQAIGNPLTVAGAPISAINYTSPQAAIAAGLDPVGVMNEWTQALAAFPTADAAVNAGVPAGVVTQLFVASRAFVPKPAQPVPPVWELLVAAGLGVLLINSIGKDR